MRTKLNYVSWVVIFTFSSVVLGGLIPDWRGQDGTTFQRWEFSTEDTTPDPDEYVNEYGIPAGEIVNVVAPFTVWLDEWYDHQGVWKMNAGGTASIDLHIPNTQNTAPDTYKEMIVQILYNADEPFLWTDPIYSGVEIISNEMVDGYYRLGIYRVIIEPNPVYEVLQIVPAECNLYVDSVIVDTICVPEPMTIILLGLGSLSLFVRKK